jgi:hypothetical protein
MRASMAHRRGYIKILIAARVLCKGQWRASKDCTGGGIDHHFSGGLLVRVDCKDCSQGLIA